jgi:pimeloyl-ACP methyl ester carboxylesterase
VFVHGAGASADFWHRQRPAFPNAHYIDLPGHRAKRWTHTHMPPADGHLASDGHPLPDARSLIEWYADHVSEYVQEAALGSVVLVGHSMGGAVVLTLALHRPTWLKALVLTSTGARLPVSPRILELLRADYRAAVELIIELSFAPFHSLHRPLTYSQKLLINGARRQMLRVPREVTLADYQACAHFDVTHRLSEVRLPTLCITGDQDRMVPPEHSRLLHERIAGSRLEVVEGAGHMLPLERPDEYNHRVEEFVAAIEVEHGGHEGSIKDN